MSTKEKLLEFIRHAGEQLGFEELEDPDLDFEISSVEDAAYPFEYTDVLREETSEVYRFCVMTSALTLGELVPFWFEQYRELETEVEDEYEGAVLFIKASEDEEDEDFWYIYRTETGEVGLFHSDYSLDDEEEGGEDDDDLDGHMQNGKE